MIEHIVVESVTPDRYALDDPRGSELTHGMALEVWIDGHWIAGRVERDGDDYYWRPLGTEERPHYVLCAGLRVRVSCASEA